MTTANFSPGTVAASGPTGEGLEPGKELTGAPLVYEGSPAQLPNGYILRLGAPGKLLLFVDGAKADPGTPNVVTQGLLRSGPDDPFGDAWYCVGAGSTIIDNPVASRSRI